MEVVSKKRVVIAPLDWGLGHATRCIPIIHACLRNNCEVLIASSGGSLQLLQTEFPLLQTFELPAYNIYYQKKGSFILKVGIQLGKVFGGIRKEHRDLKQIVTQFNPHLIIADNRYGLWHKKIKCILITHQIMIKIPGFKVAEHFVHWWLKKEHNRFTEVWIPDVAGQPNISGDLSHKYILPANTKHIGILTRFQQPKVLPAQQYDVVVIISGPEPQRTFFEQLILTQAATSALLFVVIRGLAHQKNDIQIAPNIRLIDHLPAQQLYQIILSAPILISRGGYSTLMDIASLNKKCIFVPTPGQTEQEYLVEQLQFKKMAIAIAQDVFNLNDAIAAVQKIDGFFIDVDRHAFEQPLTTILASV